MIYVSYIKIYLMKTQVIMKRMLFGSEIAQQSKTEFFSATDLAKAGNEWRRKNGLSTFNLSQYIASKGFKEFSDELSAKYGEVINIGRGRNSGTWVHPLLFIDIALAINPKLKVEVYEWLFDNLIKYRNDSGDSYKEMAAALYNRYPNKQRFGFFMVETANAIQKACKVDDWQKATEDQLRKRDKIHTSIKTLCRVLSDAKEAVRIGIS